MMSLSLEGSVSTPLFVSRRFVFVYWFNRNAVKLKLIPSIPVCSDMGEPVQWRCVWMCGMWLVYLSLEKTGCAVCAFLKIEQLILWRNCLYGNWNGKDAKDTQKLLALQDGKAANAMCFDMIWYVERVKTVFVLENKLQSTITVPSRVLPFWYLSDNIVNLLIVLFVIGAISSPCCTVGQ